MVLLTMTPAVVAALEQRRDAEAKDATQGNETGDTTAEGGAQRDASEPSLAEPAVGKPIAHSQILHLWKELKSNEASPTSLEKLLHGSHVYIPPPPSKPEPSPEYKALMARLRREQEARTYERMVNQPQHHSASFAGSASQAAFSEVNRPTTAADVGDDEVTYNDVHRQVMLIINFMVSILGVAGTLWVLARWWTLPARIFLTLGGSILVGVAEVAVYSIYVWRLGEAKVKQDAVKEIKEVVQTWVVGEEDAGENDKTVLLEEKDDGTLRRRNLPATSDPKD
ncbi:endoplasmic reticulum-based factor for assembly of V-ATPase-domain-containing protein [Stachybotrys elegans]|uniref:Endoplasmic reticulum-based factor for assembly of V-ATPase-domain-containing protein n=1 Tax=Stachybotrys elegans TaxID=80388 RepID=A0A8K0WSS4_9HYPO|nr:endoplasmic reticulum-based factor for assembly of V-ATPase-domain-containing protein [Stachybotrys elegans]